jgi:hypothetical protein
MKENEASSDVTTEFLVAQSGVVKVKLSEAKK